MFLYRSRWWKGTMCHQQSTSNMLQQECRHGLGWPEKDQGRNVEAHTKMREYRGWGCCEIIPRSYTLHLPESEIHPRLCAPSKKAKFSSAVILIKCTRKWDEKAAEGCGIVFWTFLCSGRKMATQGQKSSSACKGVKRAVWLLTLLVPLAAVSGIGRLSGVLTLCAYGDMKDWYALSQ